MKNKLNRNVIIGLSIAVVCIIISLICGKKLFELIYYSDLPEWLKYMLL